MKDHDEIESAIMKSNIVEGIKEVSRLGEGSYSGTFLLETDASRYVLKFRKDNDANRLEREYNLLSQREVVEKSLGPRVFRFDNSGTVMSFPYLLEEHIEGIRLWKGFYDKKTEALAHAIKPWTWDDNWAPGKITPPRGWFFNTMAKWYGQLHSITSKVVEKEPVSPSGYISEDEVQDINSLSCWAGNLLEVLDNDMIGRDLRDDLHPLFTNVMSVCEKNDSILQRDVYNLVQLDAQPQHVFIQKDGSIKLIDWDFAGYHIYERDLVGFIQCYDLNKEEELTFLMSYGIQPDSHFLYKLKINKIISLVGHIQYLLDREGKEKADTSEEISDCIEGGILLLREFGSL